jgi:hypothetical protein
MAASSFRDEDDFREPPRPQGWTSEPLSPYEVQPWHHQRPDREVPSFNRLPFKGRRKGNGKDETHNRPGNACPVWDARDGYATRA